MKPSVEKIVINPQPDKKVADKHIRSCEVVRIHNDEITDSRILWFELCDSVTPPDNLDCDAYLLSIIMDAMKERRDLHINGDVSQELLSNLVEYQTAWNKWLPNKYSIINITTNEIRKRTASPKAICAFSGGVDATFSVWRHSQEKYSYRSQEISFCALVHGFDIPLENEESFYKATKRAKTTLTSINLNLAPIKTNFRKVISSTWEDCFSCAVVSALSNFKKEAGVCIIGSSEPYDSLVIPWGSNPITDHLLSSDDFKVIHDGASHSRTEKAYEIAEWDSGIHNLRVCWEGDEKDKNCGTCEKCVRTRLNFLLSRNEIPPCFPNTDIIKDIKKIEIKNQAIKDEWRQMYIYGKKKNINSPWFIELEKKASYRPCKIQKIEKLRRKIKRKALKIMNKIEF